MDEESLLEPCEFCGQTMVGKGFVQFSCPNKKCEHGYLKDKDFDQLLDENERLRTALKFYADKKHILILKDIGRHSHFEVEHGAKAREALSLI